MAFNPVFAGLGDNRHDFIGSIEQAQFTCTFTGGDTYVAGGLSLVQGNFGMSRPLAAVRAIGENTAGIALGVVWKWNTQTQKLQAFFTGAGLSAALAEAGAISLTGVVLTLWAIGQR